MEITAALHRKTPYNPAASWNQKIFSFLIRNLQKKIKLMAEKILTKYFSIKGEFDEHNTDKKRNNNNIGRQ